MKTGLAVMKHDGNLIKSGQYFLITEEEARQTWGDEFEEHWDYVNGGYRARWVERPKSLRSDADNIQSVGVLHALHCVVSLSTHKTPITIKEVLTEITGLLPEIDVNGPRLGRSWRLHGSLT
jgi:hypothetical protein